MADFGADPATRLSAGACSTSPPSGECPGEGCATCDSADNLQKSFGAGGLNDVCLGCFYIWYDGPTEHYWDAERRHMMTRGESMRRASLLAKVEASWPYNGSQLPLPTPEEKARAQAALAPTETGTADTGNTESVRSMRAGSGSKTDGKARHQSGDGNV